MYRNCFAPVVALTDEQKKNRYKTIQKETDLKTLSLAKITNLESKHKIEARNRQHEGLQPANCASLAGRKIASRNQRIEGFGSTNKVQIPAADFWVLNELGILKSVSLETRSTVNYFDGAQLTREGGFVDICAANSRSVFGISPIGHVKYFNNGEFTTIYRAVLDNFFVKN